MCRAPAGVTYYTLDYFMIFTDGVHLISNISEGELHNFAKIIKLKQEWYQDKKHPHYDLTTKKAYERAINAGAKKVSSRELLELIYGV